MLDEDDELLFTLLDELIELFEVDLFFHYDLLVDDVVDMMAYLRCEFLDELNVSLHVPAVYRD